MRLRRTDSLLEIALKVRAGKLRLPEDRHYIEEHMVNLGVECLPIQAEPCSGSSLCLVTIVIPSIGRWSPSAAAKAWFW